ncbi:PREDICTED: LOW QUALITY PROTEIN: coiled-coil domain-containing protein 70 [Haliaeetus leucocephalus]|uniref:LOW QUALITY PROTEIN: coiled-coil domain-containing protein 70 n=1 Tax=Haliaeetus leucocephalus TaxID=52644 RepID=UPI00053CCEFF|nr:PREDICTED: LOW QUALITY PROTEIN: coiled-coil domain-containing protein 70 [Haliaeetus leucocephalus]
MQPRVREKRVPRAPKGEGQRRLSFRLGPAEGARGSQRLVLAQPHTLLHPSSTWSQEKLVKKLQAEKAFQEEIQSFQETMKSFQEKIKGFQEKKKIRDFKVAIQAFWEEEKPTWEEETAFWEEEKAIQEEAEAFWRVYGDFWKDCNAFWKKDEDFWKEGQLLWEKDGVLLDEDRVLWAEEAALGADETALLEEERALWEDEEDEETSRKEIQPGVTQLSPSDTEPRCGAELVPAGPSAERCRHSEPGPASAPREPRANLGLTQRHTAWQNRRRSSGATDKQHVAVRLWEMRVSNMVPRDRRHRTSDGGNSTWTERQDVHMGFCG